MKCCVTGLTIIFFLLTWISAGAQMQLGNDIDGEAAGDQSGASVALSSDGSRVVIGAPENDVDGNGYGHVRVYEYTGGDWQQMGQDIDGLPGGEFGRSVSISGDGDRVAIGAPFNSEGAAYSGQVLVYEWQNGAWVQIGQSIDGPAADVEAGRSVALSADGNHLIIGEPKSDHEQVDAGQARVFTYDNGDWIQLGSTLEGEGMSDNSGISVDITPDGNIIAIGSLGDGAAGRIKVFRWQSDQWTQIGDAIDGETVAMELGASLSLSNDGTRLAAGAPLYPFPGQARVYEWKNGSWSLLGQEIDGEDSFDRFGTSVSLSSGGNRLVVGADRSSFSGHVTFYDLKNNEWVQSGELDGALAGDGFGTSLALSATGERLAVGAPYNDGNGDNAGHVRIYQLSVISSTGFIPPHQWKIYPNPGRETVQIQGIALNGIQMFNEKGIRVYQSNNPRKRLNVSDLPAGVYEILIRNGTLWGSKKFIKHAY